jgi:hypothetical protein
MILLDYLFDNTDVLFYTFFVGVTTGAFIKATFFPIIENPITTIETPTTDSGINTINALESITTSPTLHHLTRDNLRELHNILDPTRNVSTQTGSLYDFNHSEVGIQIAQSLVDQGVQANPVLTINTQNLSSSILQSIDVRDAFTSVDLSDKSTQTLFNKLDQGIQTIESQTLINKVDQGVQNITNPMFGKDWSTIINYINNKPSFFFDAPGCDTWIIPDPDILTLISNSQFWPFF